MSIRLSKSQLDKFCQCPRCFYLAQKYKLKQPDMISSKVWKGIERITQAHYESHRQAKTTPDNLIGQVPAGAIPYQADRIDMKALRYWGKGLPFEVNGVLVTTALDDMLQYEVDGKTMYSCIDYKSKSKATDEEATSGLYLNQADVFSMAMNVNEYPNDGWVYFDYWYPLVVVGEQSPATEGDHGKTIQEWGSQIIKLKADPERIKKLILRAAACLESAMPDPSEDCPVCLYLNDREALFADIGKPKDEKPKPAAMVI